MLLNIEQGGNETLYEYIKRFVAKMKFINKSFDEAALLVLQSSLKASSFTTSLTRNPVVTLKQ